MRSGQLLKYVHVIFECYTVVWSTVQPRWFLHEIQSICWWLIWLPADTIWYHHTLLIDRVSVCRCLHKNCPFPYIAPLCSTQIFERLWWWSKLKLHDAHAKRLSTTLGILYLFYDILYLLLRLCKCISNFIPPIQVQWVLLAVLFPNQCCYCYCCCGCFYYHPKSLKAFPYKSNLWVLD